MKFRRKKLKMLLSLLHLPKHSKLFPAAPFSLHKPVKFICVCLKWIGNKDLAWNIPLKIYSHQI